MLRRVIDPITSLKFEFQTSVSALCCAADCPQWDHVLQLFVCCDDPGSKWPLCKPCRPPVWQPAPGGGGGGDGGGVGNIIDAASADGELCGSELGRWMTPFRCSRDHHGRSSWMHCRLTKADRTTRSRGT